MNEKQSGSTKIVLNHLSFSKFWLEYFNFNFDKIISSKKDFKIKVHISYMEQSVIFPKDVL